MAIERVSQSDDFGRFEGYYIRQTDIHSVATAILEPGSNPQTIGQLEEFHFSVWHKKPFGEATCELVCDDYETALQALKEFNKTSEGK